MNDLISRQAAIEYFMTNTNWHDEDGYEIHDAEDKRALLESYFDGIPSAQPEPRWIPVSERLPEDLQQVLVWYEYWHWKAEELKPEYGIGWRFRGLWCGDPGMVQKLRVIAWMPLPKPPKEEQDG